MPLHTKTTLLFILFLHFCVVTSYAQKPQKKVSDDYKSLIEAANNAMALGDYPKAIAYLTNAEMIAEGKDIGVEIYIKFVLGRAYSQINSLGDALQYYDEALSLINNNPKYDELSLGIMVDIAVLYLNTGEVNAGLEHSQKSYAKAKKVNSVRHIVLSALNISDANTRLGNYVVSRKYLDGVKGMKMGNMEAQAWKINYAESYYKEGRLKEAEAIVKQVWGNADSTNDSHCLSCLAKISAQISNAKGNITEAIAYAKQGLKNAKSIQDRADMFKLLSDIYHGAKQYQNAYVYKDSLLITTDSMAKNNQSSLYAINTIKLKINNYKNEARYNKEIRETERNVFILIIALVIVLFYFIYRSLHNRILRQKQENIITGNKQKIYELELDKLTGDIAEKNRKLSAKALYLSGRNALIEEVINALDQIPDVQQASVHNHIKNLKGHLKADNDWDDFIAHFEQVNPNFLKLLQERHEQLTATDLRFICYLYMNLELKEIASILSITIEAARKRKQRIAKKMDVDIDVLNHYLMKLE